MTAIKYLQLRCTRIQYMDFVKIFSVSLDLSTMCMIKIFREREGVVDGERVAVKDA